MEARGEVLPSARRFTQMSKHRDAQDVNRNGRFLLICFLGPDGDALIRAQAHRESFQTQIDSFCVTTAGLQPRSGSGLSEKWAGLTTVTFHTSGPEKELWTAQICVCALWSQSLTLNASRRPTS